MDGTNRFIHIFCDVVWAFNETMTRWKRNVQVYVFICREKLKIFQQILLDSSRLFENHFKKIRLNICYFKIKVYLCNRN